MPRWHLFQFYRCLFYNGGLNRKIFLGRDSLCNAASDNWKKRAETLRCVAVSRFYYTPMHSYLSLQPFWLPPHDPNLAHLGSPLRGLHVMSVMATQ